MCSHNKGERCKVKVVAVHAVKITVPTRGLRIAFVHRARLAHFLRAAGGGGARGLQRGQGSGKGGRKGARAGHNASTHTERTHTQRQPDRGLTLRAGRVTRADGGGVVRSPTGSCFKEFQTVSSGYGRFEWGAGGLTFDNSAVVVCITIIFLWLCTLSSPRVTAELNLAAD